MRTATYENASMRKHHPNPTTPMRTPASAGPTTREPDITALFKLTALRVSLSGTISTTSDRRAGFSNAAVTPPTSAIRYTAMTDGLSLNASVASATDCPIAITCTTRSNRRLSERSVTSPAHAPSTSTGPNCAPANSPSATPESVSFSTNNVWATTVSQLPIEETSWPPKNSRKLRMRSAANIEPDAPSRSFRSDVNRTLLGITTRCAAAGRWRRGAGHERADRRWCASSRP